MLQQFSVRHLTFQIKSCPFIVLIFFFTLKYSCVLLQTLDKEIFGPGLILCSDYL